jgi:flagellar export protein FliJ
MTAFKFPLKRVLDWRRTQLELEEARYKQQAAKLAELDRTRAEIEAEGIRAEVQVREWNPIVGSDLEALSTFRVRVKSREKQTAAKRVESVHKLAEQQRVMMEARRRYELLERLEERKLAEWRAARDREMDELASESFLAKWK